MTVIGGPGGGAVGFNAAYHESESAMRLVSQYKDGSGQLSLVRPGARAPWEQSIESLDSYMLDIGTLGASLGARRGIAALWNGAKALVEAAASKTRGAAVGNSAIGANGGSSLSDRILASNRTGSGLKEDASHRAASFLSKDQLEAGSSYTIRGGDGVSRELLQTYEGMNDKSGIFEFILDPTKGVTHQRFIPGGTITGVPNQKVKQ